jgi:hypothetical protein
VARRASGHDGQNRQKTPHSSLHEKPLSTRPDTPPVPLGRPTIPDQTPRRNLFSHHLPAARGVSSLPTEGREEAHAAGASGLRATWGGGSRRGSGAP